MSLAFLHPGDLATSHWPALLWYWLGIPVVVILGIFLQAKLSRSSVLDIGKRSSVIFAGQRLFPQQLGLEAYNEADDDWFSARSARRGLIRALCGSLESPVRSS